MTAAAKTPMIGAATNATTAPNKLPRKENQPVRRRPLDPTSSVDIWVYPPGGAVPFQVSTALSTEEGDGAPPVSWICTRCSTTSSSIFSGEMPMVISVPWVEGLRGEMQAGEYMAGEWITHVPDYRITPASMGWTGCGH